MAVAYIITTILYSVNYYYFLSRAAAVCVVYIITRTLRPTVRHKSAALRRNRKLLSYTMYTTVHSSNNDNYYYYYCYYYWWERSGALWARRDLRAGLHQFGIIVAALYMYTYTAHTAHTQTNTGGGRQADADAKDERIIFGQPETFLIQLWRDVVPLPRLAAALLCAGTSVVNKAGPRGRDEDTDSLYTILWCRCCGANR